MRSTLTLLFSLCLFFLAATAPLYAQPSERTLIQSIDLQACGSIVWDLGLPMELQSWNGSHIRIQLQVRLEEGDDALKALVRQGRYHLESQALTGGVLRLRSPRLSGVLLPGEELRVLVFLPEGVRLQALRPELGLLDN